MDQRNAVAAGGVKQPGTSKSGRPSGGFPQTAQTQEISVFGSYDQTKVRGLIGNKDKFTPLPVVERDPLHTSNQLYPDLNKKPATGILKSTGQHTRNGTMVNSNVQKSAFVDSQNTFDNPESSNGRAGGVQKNLMIENQARQPSGKRHVTTTDSLSSFGRKNKIQPVAQTGGKFLSSPQTKNYGKVLGQQRAQMYANHRVNPNSA